MVNKKGRQKSKQKAKKTAPLLNIPYSIIAGLILGAIALLVFISRFLNFLPSSQSAILIIFNAILGAVLAFISVMLINALFKRRGNIFIRYILALIIPIAGFAVERIVNFPNDFDVMLIIVDATRADYLSVYGADNNTTPNLEDFAEDAVVFENAIAQGCHTIQAVPAILASLHPTIHGLSDYRKVLSNNVVLISEVLKQEGYLTMGIVTNPHLTVANGFKQGYDYYNAVSSWSKPSADAVNLEYMKWLRKTGEVRKFSLLFYIDPHNPYEPPQQYLDIYYQGEPYTIEYSHDGYLALDKKGKDNFKARYLAELKYFDDRMGRLFAEMKKSGLYDKTLIVVTSDHGEGFFDHNLVFHGNSLYNELIHVPLMIKFPQLIRIPGLDTGNIRIPQNVRQIDILPTICDFLDVKKPELAQGTSLLPLVFQKTDSIPELAYILSEHIASLPMQGREGLPQMRSITSDRYKLIVIQSPMDKQPEFELYDLMNDPGEKNNIAEKEKNIVEHLSRELIKRVDSISPLAQQTKAANINKEMLDKLRALGYIK